MKIKLTFLGTSQAIPSSKRNHTAVLLSYANENILIDCGEGTQRQFRIANLNPCKLTRLLITHWHGDHILGIPGLLQTLAFSDYNRTLHIYGPKGTKRFMELIFSIFIFEGKIKHEIHEVSSGIFLETKDFSLSSLPMQHNTPCNAYSFLEKEKIRINKEKLKKLNIPNSPLIRNLQEGKDIEINGKKIKASSITFKQKSKKVTFILDTRLNSNAFDIAKDSDLLICESTYSDKDIEKANEYKHLSSSQAAEIAKKSKSKRLFLTHLSQRYENDHSSILKEARSIFKNTNIAEDLEKIEI